uniref:hypothetical protein n=1 Tax=Pseudomonas chlororaphis TaxID=587753 RepID=UPI00294FF782|nr:hypothetical protein [Pseudomonas chlororaphis]
MNWDDLRFFIAVANANNITDAGQALLASVLGLKVENITSNITRPCTLLSCSSTPSRKPKAAVAAPGKPRRGSN